MEKSVVHRAARAAGDGAVRDHRWRDREVPVELAHAGAVRLAAHHLLAGAGDHGAVPHPVRRLRHAPHRRLRLPHTHARALGEDDTGRARTPTAGLARTLGILPSRRRARRPSSDFVKLRTDGSYPSCTESMEMEPP